MKKTFKKENKINQNSFCDFGHFKDEFFGAADLLR